MKFPTKRNSMALGLLSAFFSLFFVIIAQASSWDIPSPVTYIPSSPFYSSLLTKTGIPYVYPTYEVANILLDSPVSPSKSPSKPFFVKDTWYEFSLATPLDGLYFQLFPVLDLPETSFSKTIFIVEIESPDRTVRSFYSNSFSLFSSPSGMYRFRVIGSGFSAYEFVLSQLNIKLTAPTQDYLVIEPDYILSENHWGQFDTFLSQGGHLLVISNSFFSKRYGAYFFPVNVKNTSLNFYGINITSLDATDLSSLEMLESYSAAPSECAYSRHFSTGMKGDLLQRFYCARTSGGPYTINFVSKDLLKQVLNNSKLFETIGPKLKELLSFPVPFSPASPIKPLISSPFNSIFPRFLALQNWFFLILVIFILPFFFPSIHRPQLGRWGNDFILTLRRHPFISLSAFVIILIFAWSAFILNSFFLSAFKFVGQKYSYLFLLNGHLFLFFLLLLFLFPAQARRYLNTLSNRFFFWTDRLGPRERSRLFIFFLITVTLFLYDFFIFYVKLELLFSLVFLAGIFVFFALKRNGPVSFSKLEQIIFYILLVSIFLSPFTTLSFPPDQRSYSFPASYGSDRDVSLIAEKAWSLPEGLVWVDDDFSLQIQSDIPFKSAELGVTLKGYQATLQAESGGRLTNFFISALNNFSLVKSFPPNIDLYRGPDTKVFTRSFKPTDNWKEFIVNYLPKDSSVSVVLTSSEFKPEDFPTKELPLNAQSSKFDFAPSLTFDPSFRFYTHLKNSFNLEMTFKPLSDSVSDLSSSPLRLRFYLKDSASRVIATQLFSPSTKIDSVFSFSKEDLEEDNYTFYFELALKESEEIVPLIPSGSSFSLEHLRLNSKYLILNAPTMTLTGDEVLYFKNTGNDLRYTSLLSGHSFDTLGGKIVSLSNDVSFYDFSTLPIEPFEFYKIIPPSYSGILESSKDQFFSFTRSSWFNYLNFSFTTSVYPFNNYVIVEDYPKKLLAQQDGWFSAFQSFEADRPLKSMEIPFRFASDHSIALSKNLSWILIKQIDLTLH